MGSTPADVSRRLIEHLSAEARENAASLGFHIEPQWGKDDQGYWYTATLSQSGHYWTSGVARIEAADDTAASRAIWTELVTYVRQLHGEAA